MDVQRFIEKLFDPSRFIVIEDVKFTMIAQNAYGQSVWCQLNPNDLENFEWKPIEEGEFKSPVV